MEPDALVIDLGQYDAAEQGCLIALVTVLRKSRSLDAVKRELLLKSLKDWPHMVFDSYSRL